MKFIFVKYETIAPFPEGEAPDMLREGRTIVASHSARYELRFPLFFYPLMSLLICIFFPFLLLLSTEIKAADLEVWQVTPYRVQILSAFESSPEFTQALEKDFCADLLARIEGVVGAPWDVAVVRAPDEQRRMILHSLDTMTVDQAAKYSGNFDKIMFLAGKSENGKFSVAVREFDIRSQQIGPPTVRVAWHLGKLCDAALDAVLAAFSPLANIETVNTQNRTTTLHLKAAGLPSRDPALAVIQPGMIFRPFIRLNDRDGKVRRVTPVAWTFLVVDKAAPERLDCRIESGMSTPLNAKRRSRMEQVALAIHPSPTPSVLTLQSRTEPKTPLPGYKVFEYEKESKDSAVLLGRSDWQGRISIAPAKKILRFLVVKNGGELLARLPFVPGLEPNVTAEIANDDYRLQAEGFILGLQEELVDLYVHREMLRRGVLKKIDDGDVDQAKEMFDELSRLPTNRIFSMKLSEEKKKLDTKDPVVQIKIDKMFTETQKLVDKCLDDKVVESLAQEIHDANQGVVKKEE